jgi:hypothetical protein
MGARGFRIGVWPRSPGSAARGGAAAPFASKGEGVPWKKTVGTWRVHIPDAVRRASNRYAFGDEPPGNVERLCLAGSAPDGVWDPSGPDGDARDVTRSAPSTSHRLRVGPPRPGTMHGGYRRHLPPLGPDSAHVSSITHCLPTPRRWSTGRWHMKGPSTRRNTEDLNCAGSATEWQIQQRRDIPRSSSSPATPSRFRASCPPSPVAVASAGRSSPRPSQSNLSRVRCAMRHSPPSRYVLVDVETLPRLMTPWLDTKKLGPSPAPSRAPERIECGRW